MKLIAFDGDDTLWTPLSGVNLSDRTPTDDVGRRFNYKLTQQNPPIAERDDGPRFALRPEAHAVFDALHAQGALIGVISYNHQVNVEGILKAFGLFDKVDYIVAEWHSRKDLMLARMLTMAQADGHNLTPNDLMLIDDDPGQIYCGQCERMGAGFRYFGKDITDLREVLPLVEQ